MSKINVCELLGVEENQEVDVYTANGREIIGNPHYVLNDILYNADGVQQDAVLISLLVGDYTCEAVIKHLKDGKNYYYCHLPLSYSEVLTVRFDKYDDLCALNIAVGNMFVSKEKAEQNMDKVREKLTAVRDGKAFIA